MEVSEFELIESIKNNLLNKPKDTYCSIGDDCAVVKKDNELVSLYTTDLLIENVHFDLKTTSFLELGKKAMSVNISDIAAMAGTPMYALVNLAIPSRIEKNDISNFYTGLEQIATEFQTAVIGGDLSSSPDLFYINLTFKYLVCQVSI